MVVEADDPFGVSEGQQVVISIPTEAVIQASMAIYILPILVLLVVGGVAQTLARGFVPEKHLQLVAVLSGFAGLALTYAILRRVYRKRAEGKTRPRISHLKI